MTKGGLAQFLASDAMVGTIVGVGMFGLPFAFMQAGFFVGLGYLLVLGTVMTFLFSMLAEVSLQTSGSHRLAGYVKHYFGRKWGIVMAFVLLGGSWGGIVAYVLVGGDFLHSLLADSVGGSLFVYRAFFLGVGFLISLNGLKIVTRVESYLVVGLIFAVLVIVIRGIVEVDISHFLTYNSGNFLVPYGVILFSFSGFGVVPELKDILGRYRYRVKSVILISMFIVVSLYLAFAFVVIGVTGGNTTPEAVAGLGGVLGSWILVAGSLLGFFAVATSFLMSAISLQDMFEFDFGYSRLLAWFVTLSVPTIVFFMGMNDFIKVMSFTGAVFGGSIGIAVVMIYLRMKRESICTVYKCVFVPNWLAYLFGFVFLAGAIIVFGSVILEEIL